MCSSDLLQQTKTEGALTLQTTRQSTALLKIETELTPNWTLTAFGSYTSLFLNQNDSNGATPSQIALYGKNFALQNTDPSLPTYAPYNVTYKNTDMDYLRLKGNVAGSFTVDETLYTYAYVNKTFSPRSILSKFNASHTTLSYTFGTKVNGTSFPNDIAGYTKLNAYRVWGSILRTAEDYQFGPVSGQVRAGVWLESASTPRRRFDYDINKC